MKIKKELIIFLSGASRTLHSYEITVNINPFEEFEITSGDYVIYPTWIDNPLTNPDFDKVNSDFKPLTKNDKLELADHMIEQWTKFKESV